MGGNDGEVCFDEECVKMNFCLSMHIVMFLSVGLLLCQSKSEAKWQQNIRFTKVEKQNIILNKTKQNKTKSLQSHLQLCEAGFRYNK